MLKRGIVIRGFSIGAGGIPEYGMTLKIAHRGASRYAPENTLEAFREALRRKADAVEFDVRRTKDGHLVIMHDRSVRRTTDGAGFVSDLSFQEIRKLRGPNGEVVPILQEVLDILKGRCICKIDMKETEMEGEVVETIQKNRIEDSVIITSRLSSVLKRMKRLCPAVKIDAGGYRVKSVSVKRMLAQAKRAQADIISPHYTIITQRLVQEAHKNGLEVHVWTVNDRRIIKKMIRLGVDGITSGCPDKIS